MEGVSQDSRDVSSRTFAAEHWDVIKIEALYRAVRTKSQRGRPRRVSRDCNMPVSLFLQVSQLSTYQEAARPAAQWLVWRGEPAICWHLGPAPSSYFESG